MKKIFFAFSALLLVLLSVSFTSCDLPEDADISVDGVINYGTGTYGQVNYIKFTVSGGEGPYSIYYARTGSSDWDYAKSVRSYIGSANEGETYTYSVSGYVSTGWYYYIWAVDKNGASGGGRWHP